MPNVPSARTLTLGALLLLGCAAGSAELRRPFCAGAAQAARLVPSGREGPRPLLVLLHGAGGRPADLVEPWRALAAREGLSLLAPELPRRAAFEAAVPQVLRCLVADAARAVAVDGRRVYLFGYSMGGYLALDGALVDADLFAAAALYAGALDPAYLPLLDRAARPVPFALFAGTEDRVIPLARVRSTREALAAHGFEAALTELPGADHDYGRVAPLVNARAWEFLSTRSLP